jgi:hypothetical protein
MTTIPLPGAMGLDEGAGSAMQQGRRRLLLAMPLLLWRASKAQTIPLDYVSVYLVPLADFPEELAQTVAVSLQKSMGIRIKASVSLPPLDIDTLPGTRQLIADDLLVKAAQASTRLPAAAPKTYRVFLTVSDINSQPGNFRFLFSFHDPRTRCSVVSLARMLEYPGMA